MGNSSKKIQEVIDRSLSGMKDFRIVYDQKSLKLESKVPRYINLYILFIVLPPTALLIDSTDLYALIASLLWLIAFSRLYFQLINFCNVIYLNSEEKIIEVDYTHQVSRWIKSTGKMKFDEVKVIKVHSMTSGKYANLSYYVSIRSDRRKLKAPLLNDKYKADRLRFVIEEFLRTTNS